MSPLFTDVVQSLGTPLLEIKKSTYWPCWCPRHRRLTVLQWFTYSSCAMAGRRQINYISSSRTSYRYAFRSVSLRHGIVDDIQDCNDRNPLVRALAIRTMSYIPTPIVIEALTEQLRHCLKDRDPYVRKTAAICVAKLYTADPRKAEKGGFVEMLRDLLLDSNATVVANAVAALSEIGDRQDGVIFKLNLTVANKLLTALGESSECVIVYSLPCPRLTCHCAYEDGVLSTFWIRSYDTSPSDISTRR